MRSYTLRACFDLHSDSNLIWVYIYILYTKSKTKGCQERLEVGNDDSNNC